MRGGSRALISPLVPARIVEAVRDEVRALLAHVAERHRRAD
jgi:hypothetical protein